MTAPATVRRAGAAGAIALAASLVLVQPAVLAVVVVGILWMFGLFDLRRAAIVVLGIVVVFGAAEIVNLITGGA